ncbi:hypothetical protein N8339_06620 [Gammaproteobacteria bacterium]|nr:hypothetical protein [Gammaproteobacteria bacterium]
MVDMTYSTQYVREAPEVEAYKLGLLQEAQNLYNQPMSLPAVEAAGLSGTELQGIDFAKQGVGSFEPYIQAASQGVTQGMDLTQRGALAAGAIDTAGQYQAAQDMMGRAVPVIGQGIGGILGSAQAYDPNQAASYMNPYQQQVTQNALGEMRRQADIAQTGQAAQAVGSGAFGGTREGVQRAETERGVQDLMQQRIMQDYANNYAQAQQAAMQGFESQQGRQLAGGQALGQAGMQFANLGQGIGGLTAQQAGVDISKAGALGSLGGQMGSLGTQYGALGQATQQLGAADTGLLMGLGGLERQVEQGQIDAIRSTQMQESMAPYQQLGFVSDIYRGAPTTSMALTAQTAPSASPLQTAVGLGVGALSTAAGAQKAGLF